jgi:ribonuclease P/MRP protein subunit RPP40
LHFFLIHILFHISRTESPIVKISKDLNSAMENGNPIDLVYTDFSKAFDTVPHERLLHKLKAYGISGQLLAWIRDWLVGRVQRVVLGEYMAEWRSVLSGVPQGSVLGPLMFLLFINDLSSGLQNLFLFADDGKIIGNASTQEEREILQADINASATWARTWLMLFNIAKCKVMHVGRCAKKSSHEYTMPDKDGTPCPLEVTHLQLDIGVLISDDLKLEAQCRAGTGLIIVC